MGFSDKISRALRKPIRDLQKNINREFDRQGQFISRSFERSIEPLTKDLARLEAIEQNGLLAVSETLSPLVNELDDINQDISRFPDELDSLYERVQAGVKVSFDNSIAPVMDDLDSASTILENVKNSIGQFPGLLSGFYSMIQGLLQNIIDQLAVLNPATAWNEVKGTLKIIIPIILAILIFVQALPTIVANVIF